MIDSLLGGGAERVAVDAALALNRDRYIPHLLVTRHTGPLERRLEGSGVGYTILNRRGTVSARALARARAVVRSSDLLHAHKFEGGIWGAVLARLASRPLVTHEHTFDGAASRRRAIGYRRVIAPAAARIICVSEGVADSLRAHGIDGRKLAVVPNGVPVDAVLERTAAREELGLDAGQNVIGLVARLRPEKRHELALAALASLRASGDDVILCAVGDGPRRAELRRLSDRLGVADAVVWAGERADAHRLQPAFDVTLLCSSYEGMPLAALESLVAGVPIVSTPVGAMPELLTNGSGTVVDADPDAIAAAIRETLAHRHASGTDARDRARAAYGIGRLARDLEGIYDEALEAWGAGRRRGS
jgi:glycosyltransferase involved in cell wall biosynthesis